MTMRVMLYSRVNPADRGGVQVVFNRLAAFLRARGHDLLEARSRSNPDARPGDATFPLPLLVWRGRVPAPRSTIEVLRALARLAAGLLRARPQIVNVHYATAESWYFVLLRPIFRYRLVLSVHGSDVLRPKPWDAPALARILRHADAVTCVSNRIADHVRARYGVPPERVTVIPNGVDYAFWSAVTSEPQAGAAPTLLTVGRLHPIKGHDILLRALARVRARVPGVRLVLAGDGACRTELARLADDLSIGDAVEFAGHLDPAGVRARMSRATAFVLPSRSEGLPLSLIEAMAAGLPTIATSVGGVPEVVRPGAALAVAPEDPEALARAIVAVLVDDGLRRTLRVNGPIRARQFTADDCDRAYERLMRAVVCDRDSAPARAPAGTVSGA